MHKTVSKYIFIVCVSSPRLTMLNTSFFILQTPLGKLYFKEGKEKQSNRESCSILVKKPQIPKYRWISHFCIAFKMF